MLELWTAAILSYTLFDRCFLLTGSLSSLASFVALVWLACGCHIAETKRPALLGEPPFREHGRGGSLYLEDLEDEVSIAISFQSL